MAEKKDVKRYKCTNYGACAKADGNQTIEIDAIETLGGTPECPGCHQHTLEEIVKKPFPTKLIGIIVAALVIIGGAVGAFLAFGGDKPWPEQIVLDKPEITLTVGDSEQLIPTAMPEDSKKKATFVFDVLGDSEAITVNSGGKIEALKATKEPVIISVKCEENPELASVKCKVTVVEPEDNDDVSKPETVYVTSILVTPKAVSMKEGESAEVKYAVAPDPNDETVIASSDNPEIAKAEIGTESVTITGLKAGTTIVTIMADKSGTMENVEVTVKAKEQNKPEPKQTYVRNVNLGYATYTGEVKPGTNTPHGHGTMTYKSTHKIAGNYTANSGDKYEGEFRGPASPSVTVAHSTRNWLLVLLRR